MSISETAYAKINLALHVRTRREDGYHEIETLFAFVDAGDTLSFEPAEDMAFAVTGPFAEGVPTDSANLVLRAAAALAGAFSDHAKGGARISLTKNLPHAAGIGGGSADAAATIRGLSRLWDLPDDYERQLGVAAGLGADVPACVASRTAKGTGTGIDLELFDSDLAGAPILLVNPRTPLATGPVFAHWDGQDRGALPSGSVWKIASEGRNDLEGPAIALCPPIAGVLAALDGTSPRLARMSGSGATCFALYESEAARDEAATRIAADHPGWWQLKGELR